MMETEIWKLLMDYGVETIALALAINVLTGLVKLPVKAWAKRMEDGTKLTKYLVFLPVALGFFLAVIYVKIRTGTVTFDKAFATLWLTASSLSLTLYAVFEKIFPSKEKILKDCEIEANRRLIEEIKALTASLEDRAEKTSEKAGEGRKEEKQNPAAEERVSEAEPTKSDADEAKAKIVLRGKKDAEINLEDKSA